MKIKDLFEASSRYHEDSAWISQLVRRNLNKHVIIEVDHRPIEIDEPDLKSGFDLNDSVDIHVKTISSVITKIDQTAMNHKKWLKIDFDRSYDVAYVSGSDEDGDDISQDDKCVGGIIRLSKIKSITPIDDLSVHLLDELRIKDFTKKGILEALLKIYKDHIDDHYQEQGSKNPLKLIAQLRKIGIDYPEFKSIEKSMKSI